MPFVPYDRAMLSARYVRVCPVCGGERADGRPLLCPALDKFLEVCKSSVEISLLCLIICFSL